MGPGGNPNAHPPYVCIEHVVMHFHMDKPQTLKWKRVYFHHVLKQYVACSCSTFVINSEVLERDAVLTRSRQCKQ